MVDQTFRPIKIDAELMNYSEKHRLFELFKMMLRELCIARPRDPVTFLKEKLPKLVKRQPLPRLFILGNEKVALELAVKLAKYNGAAVVPLNFLLSAHKDHLRKKLEALGPDDNSWPPSMLLEAFTERLKAEDCVNKGWMILDFPRTKGQALALQEANIIPTHVVILQNIVEDPGMSRKLFQVDSTKNLQQQQFESSICRVKECYPDIHRTFSRVSDEDLFARVYSFVTQPWPTGGPVIPRVILLGPRGSGRSTLAKGLAQKYSLIEVNAGYLVNQASHGRFKDVDVTVYLKNKWPIPDYVMANIIHQRLSEDDCREHGWVLYKYPKTLQQAQLLNSFKKNPNKVLILDIPQSECRNRLVNRRLNIWTGSHHDIERDTAMAAADPVVAARLELLGTHPHDMEDGVDEAHLRYYVGHLDTLENYYPASIHINANKTADKVLEQAVAAVFFPVPVKYPAPPEGENDLPEEGSDDGSSTYSKQGSETSTGQTSARSADDAAALSTHSGGSSTPVLSGRSSASPSSSQYEETTTTQSHGQSDWVSTTVSSGQSPKSSVTGSHTGSPAGSDWDEGEDITGSSEEEH